MTPKAKKIFDPLSIDSEPTLILWSPNIFTFKFSSKRQLLKPKTSHLLLRSFSLLNVNFLVASLHIHAMYTTTNQNGDSVFRVKNINGLFTLHQYEFFFSIRIAINTCIRYILTVIHINLDPPPPNRMLVLFTHITPSQFSDIAYFIYQYNSFIFFSREKKTNSDPISLIKPCIRHYHYIILCSSVMVIWIPRGANAVCSILSMNIKIPVHSQFRPWFVFDIL